MLIDLQHYSSQIATLSLIMTVINLMVHVLFAAAVAKDAGKMQEKAHPTLLVNGMTWAFATLIGGVFVGAVYWVLHHSKLTRS